MPNLFQPQGDYYLLRTPPKRGKSAPPVGQGGSLADPRACTANDLFPLAASLPRILWFRISTDFSAVSRVRAALMRNRVVLTTVLVLILRCPFLHGGIFTLRIVVLHWARSFYDLGA